MLRFVFAGFAIVGGLFLAAGLIFAALTIRFVSSAERTTGRVVSLRYDDEGLSSPDVAYAARDGRERVYRSRSASSWSYAVGEEVEVLYDPRDPDEAEIDRWTSLWLLPGIFAGLGGAACAIGLVGLRRRRERKALVARLLRSGQRVTAEITAVVRDETLEVNGEHPWVIRCIATLPGEGAPRNFTSRRFWYDPSPHFPARTVSVCYDPRRPEDFVVDTGDLPPKRPRGAASGRR